MRTLAIALLLAATPAHADPAADWFAAVQKGDTAAVAKRTRLPLAVTATGACFTGGTADRPRMTGVAGRRSLARLVAAIQTCVQGRVSVGTNFVAWGGESIWELRLTFDADGRLTAIADEYSYGGP